MIVHNFSTQYNTGQFWSSSYHLDLQRDIIMYFQPNKISQIQIGKLTLDVIFQTDLSRKKENQQLVNVFFVSCQEQSTRLSGQLADQFFAFQLRLSLHPVVLCQADGTWTSDQTGLILVFFRVRAINVIQTDLSLATACQVATLLRNRNLCIIIIIMIIIMILIIITRWHGSARVF